MNQMGSRNGLIQEMGFPCGAVVKNLPANSGDAGLIPGSGRSPGGGNGNPLQYSSLGNPVDKGARQATVHGIAKSWTRLKQPNTHAPHRLAMDISCLETLQVYF